MGKLTINIYKWQFSIAMLVITRGYIPLNPIKNPLNPIKPPFSGGNPPIFVGKFHTGQALSPTSSNVDTFSDPKR